MGIQLALDRLDKLLAGIPAEIADPLRDLVQALMEDLVWRGGDGAGPEFLRAQIAADRLRSAIEGSS